MTALDPVLLQLNTTTNTTTKATTFTYNDIIRYNPYHGYGSDHATYWECLSILNTFTPLSCSEHKDYDVSVILELDPTDGCTRALRMRYPNCIIYCSNLKQLNKKSRLDTRCIMADRRTPRTITEYLLTYNCRGADFTMCYDQPDYDLVRQVHYCAIATKPGAIMAARVKDFTRSIVQEAIEEMLSWFFEVWIYKCATMSCINNEAYLVGINKQSTHLAKGTLREATQLLGINEVKNFIATSKASIVDRIDNTAIADVNSLVNAYTGL